MDNHRSAHAAITISGLCRARPVSNWSCNFPTQEKRENIVFPDRKNSFNSRLINLKHHERKTLGRRWRKIQNTRDILVWFPEYKKYHAISILQKVKRLLAMGRGVAIGEYSWSISSRKVYADTFICAVTVTSGIWNDGDRLEYTHKNGKNCIRVRTWSKI